MTVEELLAVGGLGLRLVHGERPVARPIRWAHPIELLQPGRYLRGGELVLTVGSALLSDADCAVFADEVAGAGGCAIGFGLGDAHETLPEGLLRACRRLGLPLLTIQHGVPFQAVTELIADRRTSVRVAESRLAGRPAGLLLDALAEGRPVGSVLAGVVAEYGGLLTVTAADGVVELAVGEPGDGGRLVLALPGDPAGLLSWTAPHDARTGRAVLQELAYPLAVWRRERAAAHQSAERDLGRLLALVLDGTARTSALTDRLGGPRPVWATAWEPAAAARLRIEVPDLPRADLGGRIVVLTRDVGALQRLATDAGLACGVGAEAVPEDVPTSVREALAALELSVRRGRPVDARKLATLDALIDQVPADRLRPFVGQLLAPLVEHDRGTGSELVATLRAYVDSGGAVVPVARTLLLHPNTLRHRLRRIGEITGRSPFDLPDQIAYAVALRVADRTPPRADRHRTTDGGPATR
jgi:hypothetical protein